MGSRVSTRKPGVQGASHTSCARWRSDSGSGKGAAALQSGAAVAAGSRSLYAARSPRPETHHEVHMRFEIDEVDAEKSAILQELNLTWRRRRQREAVAHHVSDLRLLRALGAAAVGGPSLPLLWRWSRGLIVGRRIVFLCIFDWTAAARGRRNALAALHGEMLRSLTADGAQFADGK